jgi:hypothetical protein
MTTSDIRSGDFIRKKNLWLIHFIKELNKIMLRDDLDNYSKRLDLN